jgi:CheY-like chemotaxis protein
MKIRLIHWKPEEANQGIRLLTDAGLEVISGPVGVAGLFKQFEIDKPDGVLIDLSRAPSQGRDLAVALRVRKGTRHIPIIFVGGKAEKVENIRALLPDAGFTDWPSAANSIKAAIRAGAEDPIVPESVFAAYAGKPLAQKLGIKADSVVGLVGAPPGFEDTLGKLPRGTALVVGSDPNADLWIWFVPNEDELRKDLPTIVEASKHAPTWIAWPKKGSAIESDLTQQAVRQMGMAEGMVDYKVCSIDKTWSALLFKWRGVAP